jgi:hypothetical protein
MTDPDIHEVLSALLDREPVDPDHLAALLERPDARALLVDFVRLRSALHADGAEAAGATMPRAARPRSGARPLLAIAAAILLVTAGALLGTRFAATDDDRPPEPTRVVQLVPASGGGPR